MICNISLVENLPVPMNMKQRFFPNKTQVPYRHTQESNPQDGNTLSFPPVNLSYSRIE